MEFLMCPPHIIAGGWCIFDSVRLMVEQREQPTGSVNDIRSSYGNHRIVLHTQQQRANHTLELPGEIPMVALSWRQLFSLMNRPKNGITIQRGHQARP